MSDGVVPVLCMGDSDWAIAAGADKTRAVAKTKRKSERFSCM